MDVILYAIGTAWLGWVALNVLGLVLGPMIAGNRHGAFTNGLLIRIPPAVAQMLDADELAAVIAHEQGHRAHAHSFRNLARSCVFLKRSSRGFLLQELEADDYASKRGHGAALARALRRLDGHPLNLYRAARLDPH